MKKNNKLLASLLLLVLLSSNGASLSVLAEDVDATLSSSQTAVTTDTEGNADTVTEEEQTSQTEIAAASTDTTDSVTTSSSEVAATDTSSSEPVSSDTTQTEQSQSTTASSDASQTAQSTSETSSATSDSSTASSTAVSNQSTTATSASQAATQASSSQTTASSAAVTSSSLAASSVVNTGTSDTTNLDSLSSVTYATYVEHWTGDDAYTHNLLAHRYGITAEQLDGFLQSTGIAYDSSRINGAKLLEWEKESCLDVRAIVAIAIAESSLGTAGVATLSGANMFGYGAFDSNPSNASNYNDEVAVKALTKEAIIANKNTTFKIQDDKAKKLAAGQLDFLTDGGVYFTDTSGTGQRRAQIMEALDKWIDQHGGTPAIPEELKNMTTTMVSDVPTGYSLSTPINTATYVAATYPYGECTWYVYNRAKELGYTFDAYMGNGGAWQSKAGYETTHTPQVGYAVSFVPGQAGADSTYGHVAIVEEVKEDGSILISESNALGRGVVSYRTFTAAQAAQLTYVIGHQ